MDFGTLATIQAVLWLIPGSGFLFVPRHWVAPFEVTLGTEGAFVARLLGATFISFAVLNFLGREAGDEVGQRAIAFANVAANGLTGGLHLADLLRGNVLSSRAWGLVALTGVLTLAWLVVALS